MGRCHQIQNTFRRTQDLQRTVRCGGGQWVAVLCSVEQRVFYFFSLNKETLFFLHTHKPCLLGAERFHHEFHPLSGTSKGLVLGGDSEELHTRRSPQCGGTHAEGSGTTPLVFCTRVCFSPAHRLPLQWTDLCPPHSGAIMDSSSSHASSPICHPLLLAPPLKDVQIPLRPTCTAAASLPCLPDWRLCLPHNPFSSQRPQEPVEM